MIWLFSNIWWPFSKFLTFFLIKHQSFLCIYTSGVTIQYIYCNKLSNIIQRYKFVKWLLTRYQTLPLLRLFQFDSDLRLSTILIRKSTKEYQSTVLRSHLRSRDIYRCVFVLLMFLHSPITDQRAPTKHTTPNLNICFYIFMIFESLTQTEGHVIPWWYQYPTYRIGFVLRQRGW